MRSKTKNFNKCSKVTPTTSLICSVLMILNLASPLARASTPPPAECEQKSQVAGDWVQSQNSLAWSYFAPALETHAKNANFIFSPTSLNNVLQMLLLGAGESAKAEILKAIHAQKLDPGSFMRHIKEMNDRFAQLEGVNVRAANSLWVDKNFPLNPDFMKQLSILREYLTAQNLDFGDSNQALESINGWVREASTVTDHKTGRKVSLLSEVLKELSPDSAMVLIGTLLVDGRWRQALKTDTQFTFNNAREKQDVKGHNGLVDGTFHSDERMEFVSLPLIDSRIAIDFVMPKAGVDAQRLAQELMNGAYANTLKVATQGTLDVTLPSLDFKTSLDFANDKIFRETLGINQVFDAGNLSPMGSPQLKVAQVKQDSVLRLTGTGVQAFSATTIEMTLESVFIPPTPDFTFIANRPFWILIRDAETNMILDMAAIQMGSDAIPGTLEKFAKPEPVSAPTPPPTATLEPAPAPAPAPETTTPFVPSDTTHYTAQSFISADSLARKAIDRVHARHYDLMMRAQKTPLTEGEKVKFAEFIAALSLDPYLPHLLTPSEIREVAIKLGQEGAPLYASLPLEREELLDQLVARFDKRSAEDLDIEVENQIAKIRREPRTQQSDMQIAALLTKNYSATRRVNDFEVSRILDQLYSKDYRGSPVKSAIKDGLSNITVHWIARAEIGRQARRELYEIFARGGATVGTVSQILKRDPIAGTLCFADEIEMLAKELIVYAARAQSKATMDALVDNAFYPYGLRDQDSVNHEAEERIASLRNFLANKAAITEILTRNHSVLRGLEPHKIDTVVDALYDRHATSYTRDIIYQHAETLPLPKPNFSVAPLDSSVVPPNAPLRNQLRLIRDSSPEKVLTVLLDDPTVVGRISYSRIRSMAHNINLDLQSKKSPERSLDQNMATFTAANIKHVDELLVQDLKELRSESTEDRRSKIAFILKKQHSLTRGLPDAAIETLTNALLNNASRSFDTQALIEFVLRTQIYPAYLAN